MTHTPFPCVTKPTWFDSGKGRDTKIVRKALRVCDTCPARAACLRAGREGREFGIWGGETQPERFAALGITEADLFTPLCGNETAYRRHKDFGEECEECQEAHNARQRAYAEAAREKKRKEREGDHSEIPGSRIHAFHAPLRPICGTERGYRMHLKKGELRTLHPECTCKKAHRLHRAEQRRGEKAVA